MHYGLCGTAPPYVTPCPRTQQRRADRATEIAERRDMHVRRAGIDEQVRLHRLRDPLGVGMAEADPQTAADDHPLDVEQVDRRGDARAERARRHGRSAARASLSLALERTRPDATRQARPAVLLHQLEEIGLAPLLDAACARALPSLRAPRTPPCSRAARMCSAPRRSPRPCDRSRPRRLARATACRRGSARRPRRCPRRRRAASHTARPAPSSNSASVAT